jgi:hypothetical protein
MTTFGKISSSNINWSATTTPIDDPGAGTIQKLVFPQKGAPNFQLGVNQSTVYQLTPAKVPYTKPDFEDNTYTSNSNFQGNITLVTPNMKPSQPNNTYNSGLNYKFARYESCMLDNMRGLADSIVIGHDMFGAGYTEGVNTPGSTGNDPIPSFNGGGTARGQVFIGAYNFEGAGTMKTGLANGSYTMYIGGNTIVGTSNNGSMIDDNLDYIDTGAGYSMIRGMRDNTVFGNANSLYKVRANSGYGPSFSDNTWIGTENLGGNGDQVLSEANKNIQFLDDTERCTLVGHGNGSQTFNWAGTDPTAAQSPLIKWQDAVMIGTGNSGTGTSLTNYDYASDKKGQTLERQNVMMIGTNNCVITRYEDGHNLKNCQHDYVIGHLNKIEFGDDNYIFGRSFQSSGGNSATTVARLNKNVLIGKGGATYGTTGNDTDTKENVHIGYDVNTGLSRPVLANTVVIGYQAAASSTTATNEITLGNASIATLRCQVTSITALSDARDKENIEPLSNASAFIKDLKPVKFDWNRRDGISGRKHDMGFLAQDLDEAQSKHGIEDHLDIVYKSNPKALEAAYGKLLPILVQALKEQQEEIEKLKSKN